MYKTPAHVMLLDVEKMKNDSNNKQKNELLVILAKYMKDETKQVGNAKQVTKVDTVKSLTDLKSRIA
jgi:hypothetical protein